MKRRRPTQDRDETDDYSKLGKLVAQLTSIKAAGRNKNSVSAADAGVAAAGPWSLDAALLRELKRIARSDAAYAEAACAMALQRLAVATSDIRYKALLLLQELFTRSSAARAIAVREFKTVLDCTVGQDPNRSLPGPTQAASRLRSKALEFIEQWAAAYGDTHRELRAAYRYLSESKQLPFPQATAAQELQRQEAERRSKRGQKLLYAQFLQIKRQLREQLSDTQHVLVQMKEGFAIIAPDLFAEFEPEPNTATDDDDGLSSIPAGLGDDDQCNSDVDGDDFAWETGEASAAEGSIDDKSHQQQHQQSSSTTATVHDTITAAGLGGTGYELEITVPNGDEIDLKEAAPIVDTLKEHYTLLQRKHRPLFSEWARVIANLELSITVPSDIDRQRDTAACEQILHKLAAVKASIDEVCDRYSKLGLDTAGKLERQSSTGDSSSSGRRGSHHRLRISL